MALIKTDTKTKPKSKSKATVVTVHKCVHITVQ